VDVEDAGDGVLALRVMVLVPYFRIRQGGMAPS
jgi:hypothetical protein